MSTLNIDAIEKRANAASPGPWKHETGSGARTDAGFDGDLQPVEDDDGTLTGDSELVVHTDWVRPQSLANGKFVVRAREDVPALIARVRELEAREARVRAVIADQPRRHGDAPCSDGCVQDVCNDVLGALA